MAAGRESASLGSSRHAAARPSAHKMMLIRNTGRQVSPPMLAPMRKPATIGTSAAAPPLTGPKALAARGNCSREKFAMSSPVVGARRAGT